MKADSAMSSAWRPSQYSDSQRIAPAQKACAVDVWTLASSGHKPDRAVERPSRFGDALAVNDAAEGQDKVWWLDAQHGDKKFSRQTLGGVAREASSSRAGAINGWGLASAGA